jgi:hypothetical protein
MARMQRYFGFLLRAVAAAIWATMLIPTMLVPDAAMAGPPFRTDDPEPVELGHYEFYTFSTGTHITGDTSGVLPGFEFNYGLIPNGQLHIVAPVAFDSPADGPTVFGYGDTEIGFKYRFIEEEKDGLRPQVGTFPMLELPTGDQTRGLGFGHTRLFLPIWVQKSFGEWTTYGGGGYWINQDETLGDKNFWFFGWLLQRKVTDKLTIGGEIFHQTADNVDSQDSTGFNIGIIYDFDEHNHLLMSAGRGIQNASATNLYSWYIAWQITY